MALDIGALTGYLDLDPSKFQGGIDKAMGALKSKDWRVAGAAAGAAAAGALGVGFKNAVDLRGANAKTASQLNLTKPEAARVGKVTGELYSKNLGENMGDVSAGVGAVLGSFRDLRGASEEELYKAGEAALTFSKVMEVDVGQAATTAGTLVKTGLAEDATGAFDLLSAAAQEVGPQMVEPLMDATNEYSKHFSMLGMDGEQAMKTLANAAEGGEISLDKAGDAVKEFGIRATDLEDKGAQEALEALGLSGEDMANDLLAGGERAQDATGKITDALLGVKDPAEQAALAGGLFGTQVEDMGKDQLPGFLEAMSGTGDAMGDVEGRTKEMGDTLANEGVGQLQAFGRGVQTELIDMMSGAVAWLGEASGGLDGLTRFVQPAVLALGGLAGVIGAVNLALKIYNSWAMLTKVATGVAAAAQWVWNKALSANPIVKIVTLIGLLVGALYLFFTKTKAGQAIWETVWGAIKTAAGAVADWFMNTLVPIFAAAWGWIRDAAAAVGDWFTGTLWPLMQTVFSAIGSVATWLWQNIMQPVWTGIKVAIAIAVTAVATYIDLMKWYFTNVIAPVATWLWKNIITPAFQGIRAVIGAMVTWFRDTAWPILQAAFQAVATAANWLWKNVLRPAWQGIQAAISAVVNWFRDTAWPWINRVIGYVAAGFRLMRDTLGTIWAYVRNSIIAPVIAWFRDVVWGRVLSPTIDAIKRGFRVMRDSLKDAWKYVRNNVIGPVADWFRDTVKPLFDRATGGIEDAFTTLKNAIKKAWEAIKDTAKTPVKFVVDKIINDAIIGNYNDVAGVFGLDPISDVSLPSGWARGGILPGGSNMSDGDDQVIRARRGEGMYVSEGLRDSKSRSLFEGANAAARTGTSFADYVQGYARGGIVLRQPFNGSAPMGDGFGARGGSHKGIDWPLAYGTALKAVADGVAQRTYNSSAGRKLNLNIGDGLTAGYHHLSRYGAASGASVGSGSTVGYVGSSGHSTGPHLHFSMKRDGSYVDPAPYLGAGGAGGTGGSWNPFAGLWDSLSSKVREGVGDSPFGDMLFNLPKKVIGGAVGWVGDKITALGDWGADAVQGVTGRARWAPAMTKALSMKDQFGPMRLKWGLDRLMQESSGDPNAVNNWDSNAAAGNSSRGLMQVIPSTFRAYAESGYGSNIFDPMSNILASINYTLARYGSLKDGWTRAGGYERGTVAASPGWHMVGEAGPEMVKFRGGERVLTAAESRRAMADGPASWSDEDIERFARVVADEVRNGSREGVAAGLSGSAQRARTMGRQGIR
ncbi:MAG: peptidoglycan DD-metalloendopeptidase family protein [Brachybacterium sp.]|uniref:peptidoglycan DD-metalloendopeptidase family protein n=1 Tax=Brachybacterium sp. TaxID=1891286 RepID=UPI002647BA3E|nr:peptidoglycan DD-metalloendopeptidase family protein [Brachybacterium sp.]MDN5686464.1 peptidoglycan DD-metalloendopeptidase family protein [Brachybacterium sp.]